VVMQLAYFILLARSLGAEDLGKFTAVASLTTIAYPFATLGADFLLSRDVSRDPSRARVKISWGNALLLTSISSSILILILFFVAWVILPKSISLLTLLFVFLAEIFFMAVWGCIHSILIALNCHRKSAQLGAIYNFTKLLAVLIFAAMFRHQGVQAWTFLYAISTFCMVLVGCLTIFTMVGFPDLRLRPDHLKEYVREGIYFSIGGTTACLSANIDKTLLASFSTLEATGLYSAAFRFIGMANLPLGVLSSSLHAKFFSEGKFGIAKVFQFGKQFILPACIYGVVVFIGFLFLGPFIPFLLGDEYRDSIPALYWLAPLPFLSGLSWIATDILDGSGHQRSRSFVNISSVFFTLPLCYLLIPKYSWKGAAWATVLSSLMVTICYWGVVCFLKQKEIKLRKYSQIN